MNKLHQIELFRSIGQVFVMDISNLHNVMHLNIAEVVSVCVIETRNAIELNFEKTFTLKLFQVYVCSLFCPVGFKHHVPRLMQYISGSLW